MLTQLSRASFRGSLHPWLRLGASVAFSALSGEQQKANLPREKERQVSIQEQVLSRNVERFRGGLEFKAHKLVYHSTRGSRVMKKKKEAEALRADLLQEKQGQVPRTWHM